MRAGKGRPTMLLVACCALAALALPASATAAPKGFYGVVPQEALSNQDYANLAEGGVGTVRIGFHWASFQQVDGQCKPEPQVDVCSWTVMDGIVGNLAAVGVRAFPTFSGVPSFVNEDSTRPPLEGRDLARWKAFLQSAAERYGPKGVFWQSFDDYGAEPLPIKDWQVWNEPNSRQFWSPAPNARKYAKLVKASAKALRNGDPKANVVLGGMFADAKVPMVPYMRDFYRVKKISRSFDEIAIHPYAKNMRALKRQLAVARKAARGKDRIRVTELGWSSANSGHPLNQGKKGQAKMLKKSFKLITRKRKAWSITGIIWFALRDTNNPDTCRFCNKSGLFNRNGKAKPSWREFKRFSK